MKITDIRIRLITNEDSKLKAVASITIEDCFVVGTGGYGSLFAEKVFDVFDNELAMKGLKYIADIN